VPEELGVPEEPVAVPPPVTEEVPPEDRPAKRKVSPEMLERLRANLAIGRENKAIKKLKGKTLFKAFLEEIKGKENTTRLQKMLEKLYQTAIDCKSKNQVLAAKVLLARAYGQEPDAEDDIDSLKRRGFALVYFDRPAVDPDIPVAETMQLEPPKAEFIDAEFEEDRNG
jgi:hypothetical protein